MSVKGGRNGELMKKKLISAVLSTCTLLSMTACATNGQAGISGASDDASNTQASESELPVSEDNLIPDVSISAPGEPFKFEGKYYSDRCYISFEKGEGDKVNIKAGWSGSYNTAEEWTMTGTYDSASYCIEYTGGVKKDVVYKDANEVDKEDTIYSDGTGTFLFSISGDSVTWTDKKEDVANGKIFQLDKDSSNAPAEDTNKDANKNAAKDSNKDAGKDANKDANSGDKNFYRVFTDMDKDSVEKIAAEVRDLYLAEDWEGIKKYVKYPVNVRGTICENEADFDKAIKGKKVTAEDRKAMEDEDCKDMFSNSHGLCFGSGEIWMQDGSALTDGTPEIHIITISGIG